MMKIIKTLLPIMLPGIIFITGACANADHSRTESHTGEEQEVEVKSDSMPSCIKDCLMALAYEHISVDEKAHLLLMREEELMAQEVYEYLYSLYPVPVFNNISKSERIHTMTIKILLDKYHIDDPAKNHVSGVFRNPDIQQLYDSLTNMGSHSLLEALIVGISIEDLDIADLQSCLQDVDNTDIRLVFENLNKGSRNHMRAFNKQLSRRDYSYIPQYITPSEYETIINSAWERGNGLCTQCIEQGAKQQTKND